LSLIQSGILDSLARLNLVAFLEKRFGVEIAAHEASTENLDTIDNIAALVESKLPG
jgi:acyl carrier protein